MLYDKSFLFEKGMFLEKRKTHRILEFFVRKVILGSSQKMEKMVD
jgi:hypothetical protein